MTAAAVAIVPITLDHAKGYRRAVDVVARERRYLTLLEAPSEIDSINFVAMNIAQGNPMIVALAAGEVVGWCDVRRFPFPSHAHRGTVGLGVLPFWRGRGIGRRLFEAALDEPRRADFKRIELNVHADDERAISLYENVSFVREGVLRNASFIDGVFCDAIVMAIIDS